MSRLPCIPTSAIEPSATEPTPQSPSPLPAPDLKPESTEGATLRSAAGLLALRELPGVGPKTTLRLALLAAEFDPHLDGHARLWQEALPKAQAEVKRCRAAGIAVVSIFEDAYPQRLRTIAEPPPVLFVKGALQALQSPRPVAIAGSRQPMEAGLAATEQILAALATEPWLLLGGTGKGIDAAAHRAAIAHGAPTAAVMTGGLGASHPKHTEELSAEILAGGGALLSEYRIEAKPARSAYMHRTRILTGIAAALILTQAAIDDGALYAVRYAAEQRRPIFCAEVSEDGPEDEGLRVLLDTPAERLHERLPAFERSKALCARLGERPLARPLAQGDGAGVRAALDAVIAAEPESGFEPRWPLPNP